MADEINEIVVADKANEIGEIVAANEAIVNEAVLTNKADKVSVAKKVIDAGKAIILFDEELDLASEANDASKADLAINSQLFQLGLANFSF